jgi:hypothetical protein
MSLDGNEPSLCNHDFSQDEFREADDKLSKPRVLFKQRHGIVVGVLVISVVVTSKWRFIEASLNAMRRTRGSHGQSPIHVVERAPVSLSPRHLCSESDGRFWTEIRACRGATRRRTTVPAPLVTPREGPPIHARSSRRVRTLVTQLARSRPIRESGRMRADIHGGPEHTLQSEAGYSIARPRQPDRRKPLAPHGWAQFCIHRLRSPFNGRQRPNPWKRPAPMITRPSMFSA